MKKNTTKGLSEVELNIIARLTYEDKKIYSLNEIKKFLPSTYNNVKNLINSLKNKKLLVSIKKGVYVFVPIEFVNKGVVINELIIPSVFFDSSEYYIGYSTMYNFYNLYEQKFQTVYVINSKFSQVKKIMGISFKFIKVSENRLYGSFIKKLDNVEVSLASLEKTLIDLLYFNKPVGGIKNAINIFEKAINSKKVDIDFLLELALNFPVIKTRKIVGYILENKLKLKHKKLTKLYNSITESSLISINGNRSGHINKKWGLILNDSS
jgi:predicted transcriptional regulator of viral defense system